MTPTRILKKAGEQGIDLVAVTDHNSVGNCKAALSAARDGPVDVLPGIEVTTREEVHVVGLFDNLNAAREVQRVVYNTLPGENTPEIFGDQIAVNEHEEVVKFETAFLASAVTMSLGEVVDMIHGHGGLAIASHIDRERNSVINHLGLITGEMGFDALEMYDLDNVSKIQPYLRTHLPIIQSSDAHFPGEIGTRITRFRIMEPSIRELKRAFQETDGRGILSPGVSL